MLGSEFSAPKMIAFYFARHEVLDGISPPPAGINRHYVVSSSTRSVPVANTDERSETVSINVLVGNHSHKHIPDDHRKQDVVSIMFWWGT